MVNDVKEEKKLESITDVKGDQLPYTDLWVGSFPYQDISLAGSRFIKTLQLFKYDLEKNGYTLYDSILDSSDYSVPQKWKRYFLIAILGEYSFSFPKQIETDKKIIKILEKAEDKYFLTTNEYISINNHKRIYCKKNNPKTKYEIDINKFLNFDKNLYHQAGNSIVVDVMYFILKQLLNS